MTGGKLVHLNALARASHPLRLAITNFRKVRKLTRVLEDETERLIDAERRPANPEPEDRQGVFDP